MNDALKIGTRITVAPIIHGSGDCAVAVRRLMLEQTFDCVAVPLPPSFQADVEGAIMELPTPRVVIQSEAARYTTEWTPESDRDDEDDEADGACSYVPIDPCQPVISALRSAMGEHTTRAFIDLETSEFHSYSAVLPDAYALKRVSLEQFAAAMLPAIPRPQESQRLERIAHMALRLRDLEKRHKSILFVCSVLDWPWIREAYASPDLETVDDEDVEQVETHRVAPQTLTFLLGELPFVTGLYERARSELDNDENLSIDGVKQLLIVAREAYRNDFRGRARKITPQSLRMCLKYIRNLSLLERRLTPDLYSIAMATKQCVGDGYAMHVVEAACSYLSFADSSEAQLQIGIDQAQLPNGDVVSMTSRLPGPPTTWRSLELRHRPDKQDVEKWQTQWNPYRHCSWPPEDEKIENFRAHVVDRAKTIMGADLVKTEKFTTSVKDGIDVRDTLRNWHTGDIYVKEMPPVLGHLDCVVMLFDSPADPRDYPWRTTWYAEHGGESTMALFATDYRDEMVGPGIALATYGGAFFLYPPRSIPDIWNDEVLDFAETLEDRLVAAACLHSECKHIALLAPAPPGAGWRRMVKRFGKSLVHIPLAQFSDATVQQLRMAHVLNGQEVRSFASHFIRKA